MQIGNRDTAESVYVVAEVGGNHNGDADTAYRLVEEAAGAGADAVKFQTYTAETLIHPSVEPVPIVRRFYATQFDRFKGLELDWPIYERVIEMCKDLGLDFMTTAFDLDILERFLPTIPAVKIASGDITFAPLIAKAAASGKPVFVSTGMSALPEIENVAATVPNDRLCLLHCVSLYPLPDEQANLAAIRKLAELFPTVTIGYSDHSIGIDACLAAVAMGARVVEKHFTLDKAQVPGDHPLSADPGDLRQMVETIRRLQVLLGDAEIKLADGEDAMRDQMRRGLYAARDLAAGHVLTDKDIAVIRPVAELAPGDLDEVIGKTLKSALTKDQMLRASDLMG